MVIVGLNNGLSIKVSSLNDDDDMMMMMMMMNVTIKEGQEGTMVRFLILICNILFQHFLSVDGVNLTQSLETNF